MLEVADIYDFDITGFVFKVPVSAQWDYVADIAVAFEKWIKHGFYDCKMHAKAENSTEFSAFALIAGRVPRARARFQFDRVGDEKVFTQTGSRDQLSRQL